MRDGWQAAYGGKLEFVKDSEEILRRAIAHIDERRAALGLAEYDPSRFGSSGDARMEQLESLPLQVRSAALYGASS